MQSFDLKLYIPQRNNAVAHVVRQYPDGNIYIFCNRYLGEANGKIIPIDGTDATNHYSQSVCPKCQSAIEMAIERMAVLVGLRPGEAEEYASRIQAPASN